MRQLSPVYFTSLTILCEEFHQRRLADNVCALACLLIDDGDTMAMFLHEGSAEVGKAARFRHRHKRVAGGQVRNGNVVGTDVDELFLFVSSNLELRQRLRIRK